MSGIVIPSALFLFLKIAAAIWGHLWFCMTFCNVCSISVKYVMATLIGIAFILSFFFSFFLIYSIRKWCSFFFCIWLSNYPSAMYTLSLSHCMFLPPLSNINWLYRHGCISELSVLFHWCMCVFLCQYCAVFITTAL